MAITKTYLYNSDAATELENVYAWLQANAVPEYFDTVTTDGTSVTCTVDGVEMLKYTPGATSNCFVITTKSGVSRSVQSQSVNGSFVCYAYKCANGIAFTPNISAYYDLFTLIITKNNNGETTVVSNAYFSYSSIGNIALQNISAVSLSCVAPLKMFTFTRTDYNITTRVPFPCNGELGNPTYTPNAFYLPHSQSTAAGVVLTIDGVDYISSGYWAIKDE